MASPPYRGSRRPGGPRVKALHAFAGCGFAILVAGTVAVLSGQPWLFPSLGPTAMLQTEQPTADSSCPRNTVTGHVVALAAGYGSLLLFGLTRAGPVISTGVDGRRVGAAVLSLAATASVLLLVRRPHAPAGATTLIVSLGLLPGVGALFVSLAAVCLVTAVDWVYNRLTGAPMPVWAMVPAGADVDRSGGEAGR